MKKEKSTLSILENIRRKIRRIEGDDKDDKVEVNDEHDFEYFDASAKGMAKDNEELPKTLDLVESEAQAEEKIQSVEKSNPKEAEGLDPLVKPEDEELGKDDFLDSDNYDDFLAEDDSKKEQPKINKKIDQVKDVAKTSKQKLNTESSSQSEDLTKEDDDKRDDNSDFIKNEQIIDEAILSEDEPVKVEGPGLKNKTEEEDLDGLDLDFNDEQPENQELGKSSDNEVEDFLITEVEQEQEEKQNISEPKVVVKENKKDSEFDDLSDISLDDEEFTNKEKKVGSADNKTIQDKEDDLGLNLDDIDLEDDKDFGEQKAMEKQPEISLDSKNNSGPVLDQQSDSIDDGLIKELEDNSKYMASNDDHDLETQASKDLNLNIKKISSGIVSSDVANKTTESIKKLFQAMPKKQELMLDNSPAFKSGETIEDMVVQILTPKLEQWMNENLPVIVEKIVSSEIKKLIPKDN